MAKVPSDEDHGKLRGVFDNHRLVVLETQAQHSVVQVALVRLEERASIQEPLQHDDQHVEGRDADEIEAKDGSVGLLAVGEADHGHSHQEA